MTEVAIAGRPDTVRITRYSDPAEPYMYYDAWWIPTPAPRGYYQLRLGQGSACSDHPGHTCRRVQDWIRGACRPREVLQKEKNDD